MLLPTPYYVYIHEDPRDGIVRYVGQGSAGRAWACAGYDNGKRGSRTTEHRFWIEGLLNLGCTPADYVKIISQGLSRKEALRLEKEEMLKHDFNLLFNRPQGVWALRLDRDQLLTMRRLRLKSISYKKIGKLVGTSTMTAYRALNNLTEGYKDV